MRIKNNLILIIFALLIIFLIDNFIHYNPHLLPKKFLNFLSYKAQARAKIKNPDLANYIYEEHIFYAKPNLVFPRHKGDFLKSDTNGYFNKDNSFEPGSLIDILIIGDSFTIDQSIFLKKKMGNKIKIYNVGIGGQGVYHWKYQYKRFLKLNKNVKPKLILLNYYEGNDLEETDRAILFQKLGYTNSAYYPTNQHYNINKFKKKISYFDETKSLLGNLKYYLISNYKKRVINQTNDKIKIKDAFKHDIKYSNHCYIKLENGENLITSSLNQRNILSVNYLKETLDFFSSQTNAVFFNYVPSTYTIYHYKLNNNKNFSGAFETYLENLHNLKTIIKDTNIILINLTKLLINKSKSNPLHDCEAKDSHFSNYGNELLAKNLFKIFFPIFK